MKGDRMDSVKKIAKIRAFTLLELLVVLAIIAVLISILVPGLNKSREMARTVICRTKVRDYSLIHYGYLMETDQFIPLSVKDPVMRPWTTLDSFRKAVGLNGLADAYKQRRSEIQEYKPAYPRSYMCPSARHCLRNPEDGLYALERSYGLNAHPYYQGQQELLQIKRYPSKHLCAADALDWWFNYWECDKYDQYGDVWLGFETYGMVGFRHSGKANVSFWDGRVETMKAEEVKENLYYWLR